MGSASRGAGGDCVQDVGSWGVKANKRPASLPGFSPASGILERSQSPSSGGRLERGRETAREPMGASARWQAAPPSNRERAISVIYSRGGWEREVRRGGRKKKKEANCWVNSISGEWSGGDRSEGAGCQEETRAQQEGRGQVRHLSAEKKNVFPIFLVWIMVSFSQLLPWLPSSLQPAPRFTGMCARASPGRSWTTRQRNSAARTEKNQIKAPSVILTISFVFTRCLSFNGTDFFWMPYAFLETFTHFWDFYIPI